MRGSERMCSRPGRYGRHMCTLIRMLLVVLPLAVLAPACDEEGARHGSKSDASLQRAMLSEGYSLLYADTTQIRRIGLVLHLKAGSQEFDDALTEVGRFG